MMKDDGGFTTCQLRAAGESDRSDKTLWERTTQRKKSDAPGTPGVGSSRAVPVVAYAACACLTMALTVLIVEMIVLLGVAAGEFPPPLPLSSPPALARATDDASLSPRRSRRSHAVADR